MGVRPGTGTRQTAILAALDGVPAEAGELARQILGREPTHSEFNSLNRAAHDLARLGLVKLARVPRGAGGGPGAPRLYLLKVSAWVRDGDGAAGQDTELSHAAWLDAAWEAFGTDYRYAEELAEAGRKLGQRVRDIDQAGVQEARQLRVAVDGLEVRHVSDGDGGRG